MNTQMNTNKTKTRINLYQFTKVICRITYDWFYNYTYKFIKRVFTDNCAAQMEIQKQKLMSFKKIILVEFFFFITLFFFN